ncbi:arrestin (or S-antigen) [Purpureocillium lilacinum]|uniref:Arrestin (Or S-antigen) n=1 Tax=Purpureocillium lilacinum TaxID=33203 RepID=A0A179FKM2_PURLI|nr:arrestin (or S-antigen) [Purpureocillium lilacinum]
MSLCRGGHTFQFSALLESQLPASVDTPVYRIMYEFEAELCVVQSCRTSASMYKFSRTLTAKRSLPQPLYLHHTLRVFPPTNIIADVNYNKVVYPNASNDLTLKLDGLKTENKHPRTAELWKLKTIAWRLVETTKTISPITSPHEVLLAQGLVSLARSCFVKGGSRTFPLTAIRRTWSSDSVPIHQPPGIAEMTAERKCACSFRATDGTEVNHSPRGNLVITQECAQHNRPQLAAETGVRRILETEFPVILSEPVVGVSWDKEAPPICRELSPSPPGYS